MATNTTPETLTMLLAPEDTADWTDHADLLDYTPSGLWFVDDPDDGDGETDDCPTPLVTVVPWPGGYDDDRRRGRLEGEQLLHLDADEWDVIDDLLEHRVSLTGVGTRCAHSPHYLPDGYVGRDIICRPSPVMGGTFLIFPGE